MRHVTRFATAFAVASGLAATGCSGGDERVAGPIERGLELLPEDAVREIRDDGYEIYIGDLVALSDAADLDGPEPGRDDDDVVEWLVRLGIGDVEREDVDATAVLPESFRQVPVVVEDFDEILGLDVGAVESYAVVSRPPNEFTALSGQVGFPRADLDDGLGTLGDGEEGEIDLENTSAFNRIGRTLQLAERDGAVAYGTSVELAEEWVGEDTSLAEDEDLLALARALDDAGAIAADFFAGDFDVERALAFGSDEAVEVLRDAVVITETFDVVATGTTVVDGDVGNVVAYLFDDDGDAAAAIDGIEEVWDDGDLLAAPVPVDELYDLESVEQFDAVVLVRLTPVDRDTAAIVQLLVRLEPPFLHR